MSNFSTPITTYDAPLGFNTEKIVAAFDGIIYGLGPDGVTATNVYVQKGISEEVTFTQINSQASDFTQGGGLSDITGKVWALTGSTHIYKTGILTAIGDTNIWTPPAGKRWRLEKYQIFIPSGCASAAPGNLFSINFKDNATPLNLGFECTVPTTAVTAGPVSQGSTTGMIELPGNGILSAAEGNILKANLNAALTAGNAAYLLIGKEES